MRRIENMKTMMIDRAATDLTARHDGCTRAVPSVTRLEWAASSGAAIERQLDEIQHTFSARWEW
jgi:hypothetical protein